MFVSGLILTLSFLAVLWTAIPVFRTGVWWIRVFDFPRVQLAALLAGVFAAYIWRFGFQTPVNMVLASTILVCLLYQVTRIVRYTSLFPMQVPSVKSCSGGDEIKLMVANVLMTNRQTQALFGEINKAKPDLLLLLETDAWWDSELNALQPDYPNTVRYPLENLYGIHLLSKLELVDPRVRFHVEDSVPSIETDIILPSGTRITVHCLHPAPPSPTENETSDQRDAELLLVGRSVRDETRPVIVMGDLNDVAWSDTARLFQRISELVDPRVGRGMFNTFHAKIPFLRFPLDHVFCSADFAVLDLKRLDGFGSDHFPIFAHLCYGKQSTTDDQVPSADAADASQAQEKIDKVQE